MNMDFRLLCLLIVLKWAHARQAASPGAGRQQAFYFHRLQYYPAYQIVNAQQADASISSTESPVEVPATSNTSIDSTTSSSKSVSSAFENSHKHASVSKTSNNATATSVQAPPLEASTANTMYTPAEFPHDLLEIARSKLGLKSLDEVPSISELAEYLGTTNAEETIKYIRHLTATDQGIALIKAYLESADFTDRTEESRRHQQPQATLTAPTIDDETTKPNSNLLQRVAAYFHIYNLWPQSGDTHATETSKQVQEHLSKYVKAQMQYRKRMQAVATHRAASAHANRVIATPHHKPLLVRNPLPYHYPIPLRPISGNRLSPEHVEIAGVDLSQPVAFTPVHLNTPRLHVPRHIQLARAANIPPKQLETLLQSKPRLAELAARVNHLPLTNEHSALIDAQLLAAVRRAVEQDDDLRKLLQTTAETLK